MKRRKKEKEKVALCPGVVKQRRVGWNGPEGRERRDPFVLCARIIKFAATAITSPLISCAFYGASSSSSSGSNPMMTKSRKTPHCCCPMMKNRHASGSTFSSSFSAWIKEKCQWKHLVWKKEKKKAPLFWLSSWPASLVLGSFPEGLWALQLATESAVWSYRPLHCWLSWRRAQRPSCWSWLTKSFDTGRSSGQGSHTFCRQAGLPHFPSPPQYLQIKYQFRICSALIKEYFDRLLLSCQSFSVCIGPK